MDPHAQSVGVTESNVNASPVRHFLILEAPEKLEELSYGETHVSL
ncbi:MAG: hypothetical protein P1V97_02560 [Planctomycetota bacterium]|nr:hypothetical protein [Planctomycetota bacterium]